MKNIVPICAILLLVAFSGCIQQIAMKSLGGIMDNGFAVLNEEQDLTLADASISSNLILLESILRSDPENEHYLLLASMGYSSYSLGFAEDDSIDRAKLFYARGKEYGRRILQHHNLDPETMSVEALRSALASFSKDNVPAIFWTATGWGSLINLSLTDPAALADLPKVEAMMQFVAKNEPAYFYGGAHFFLGTLFGSRPQMLGGNPDSSKKEFEECLRINGGKFLLTYIYYARSYAVQTQNRDLFEQFLARVDSASINTLPEARLSNAIAKKKSRLLRARADDLF